VIDPGVRAAVRATHNGRVGLIGTEATVTSGAYERALHRTGADVRMFQVACPRFVDYVERGDTTSAELQGIARHYLEPLAAEGIDTLILGCTHYPMLSGLIARVIGPQVQLVSSAQETAKDVYAALIEEGLQREDGDPEHEFVCTGDPDRFTDVAERFLGPSIPQVRHAVPGGFRAAVGDRGWS